jgi:hypothetical protein
MIEVEALVLACTLIVGATVLAATRRDGWAWMFSLLALCLFLVHYQ